MSWSPRDVAVLPGFAANMEFGLDAGAGRQVVPGCPPDRPSPERNRYLIWLARRHGMPVLKTRTATTAAADALCLDLAGQRVDPARGIRTATGRSRR